MPNARKASSSSTVRYTRRTRTSRAKTLAKARKAPVRTIAKNTRAIRKLKTVVNAGNVQRNFQLAKFVGSDVYALEPSRPFCLALNDFTHSHSLNLSGGQIFGPVFTGLAPNIDCSAIIIGQWHNSNPAGVAGLAPKYRTWTDNNDDLVSPVFYVALGAKYTFTFNRPAQSEEQGDLYIRADIMRSKREYTPSEYHSYNLPGSLGVYGNLCLDPSSGRRNKINPALWYVKTRYIKIKRQTADATNVARTMTINYKPKQRKIKLDLDDDITGAANTKEPFHLAIPSKNIEWLMFSISGTPVSPATDLQITATRQIVYRDPHGVAP